MPSILFSGLDPVPIRLDLTAPPTLETLYAAASMPASPFIQTVQPYQIEQRAADHYELVLGPKGFGAELFDALRWLAHVAAAGILSPASCTDTTAFVKHYLEVVKPEWGYEELTAQTETFISDRYQRATTDLNYQHGLESQRNHPDLASLMTEITQWCNSRNAT